MSRPSSEAKKAMTLADALEWYFGWIHTTMDSPSIEIAFVKRLRALESELAKRRDRDAEIAKRLSAWIDGVELAASTKSYLGDLFNILYDLKAEVTEGQVR